MVYKLLTVKTNVKQFTSSTHTQPRTYRHTHKNLDCTANFRGMKKNLMEKEKKDHTKTSQHPSTHRQREQAIISTISLLEIGKRQATKQKQDGS